LPHPAVRDHPRAQRPAARRAPPRRSAHCGLREPELARGRVGRLGEHVGAIIAARRRQRRRRAEHAWAAWVLTAHDPHLPRRSHRCRCPFPRSRPHDRVASVACGASSTSLRSRVSCLRTDSSAVAVTYAYVPIGNWYPEAHQTSVRSQRKH
jgi:hypothetical protein